ncbi:hypothetical protein LshimejAT787_1802170 [Lyophyllum shimeji]|uniref:Uncharacterized protein n=1 Tax=Lyophyllum shimeji TaxID=47721 RepID=A0A9P3PXK0_LYOSH|nr:hypothetical protein LshimejAT787_1802170 [Lyophyllum shimeji]
MHSSTLLTVPAFESLALSNCNSSSSSSSSSSSLFSYASQSSDSQTDISPPRSPLEGRKLFGDTEVHQTPTLGIRLSDAQATPQLPCARALHAVVADVDIGYESEIEGPTNVRRIRLRPRHLTRKKEAPPESHGLRRCPPSLGGQGFSPSPVLQLQSRSTSPAGRPSPQLPPTPTLKPQLLSEDAISPLVLEFPESVKRPQIDRISESVFECNGDTSRILCSPSAASFSALDSGSSRETPPRSIKLSQPADFVATSTNSSELGTRKALSGIGLGLPSTLGRPRNLDQAPPLPPSGLPGSSPTAADEETDSACPRPKNLPAPFPAPSSNHCEERPRSCATRFFQTYHFSKRRLYDIPESVSPKRPSPKARTYAARGRFPGFDCGSWSRAAVEMRARGRRRSPILDGRKIPVLWLNASPPVVIRPEEVQNLNLGTVCEAQASVLF